MILITDPEFLPDEELFINAFFSQGLETLHLRKPQANIFQMEKLLSKIESKYHPRIMIHSNYDLINRFQIKGLHFTGKTKGSFDNYKAIECQRSLSAHSLAELKNINPLVDYAFLCPIFPSISKIGYAKQWDIKTLKQQLSTSRKFKIVALGGINLQNTKTAMEYGFDDFAVLGNIWNFAKESLSLSVAVTHFKQFQYAQ